MTELIEIPQRCGECKHFAPYCIGNPEEKAIWQTYEKNHGCSKFQFRFELTVYSGNTTRRFP